MESNLTLRIHNPAERIQVRVPGLEISTADPFKARHPLLKYSSTGRGTTGAAGSGRAPGVICVAVGDGTLCRGVLQGGARGFSPAIRIPGHDLLRGVALGAALHAPFAGPLPRVCTFSAGQMLVFLTGSACFGGYASVVPRRALRMLESPLFGPWRSADVTKNLSGPHFRGRKTLRRRKIFDAFVFEPVDDR